MDRLGFTRWALAVALAGRESAADHAAVDAAAGDSPSPDSDASATFEPDARLP